MRRKLQQLKCLISLIYYRPLQRLLYCTALLLPVVVTATSPADPYIVLLGNFAIQENLSARSITTRQLDQLRLKNDGIENVQISELEHVELIGQHISPASLKTLFAMPRLKSVFFRNCTFQPSDYSKIENHTIRCLSVTEILASHDDIRTTSASKRIDAPSTSFPIELIRCSRSLESFAYLAITQSRGHDGVGRTLYPPYRESSINELAMERIAISLERIHLPNNLSILQVGAPTQYNEFAGRFQRLSVQSVYVPQTAVLHGWAMMGSTILAYMVTVFLTHGQMRSNGTIQRLPDYEQLLSLTPVATFGLVCLAQLFSSPVLAADPWGISAWVAFNGGICLLILRAHVRIATATALVGIPVILNYSMLLFFEPINSIAVMPQPFQFTGVPLVGRTFGLLVAYTMWAFAARKAFSDGRPYGNSASMGVFPKYARSWSRYATTLVIGLATAFVVFSASYVCYIAMSGSAVRPLELVSRLEPVQDRVQLAFCILLLLAHCCFVWYLLGVEPWVRSLRFLNRLPIHRCELGELLANCLAFRSAAIATATATLTSLFITVDHAIQLTGAELETTICLLLVVPALGSAFLLTLLPLFLRPIYLKYTKSAVGKMSQDLRPHDVDIGIFSMLALLISAYFYIFVIRAFQSPWSSGISDIWIYLTGSAPIHVAVLDWFDRLLIISAISVLTLAGCFAVRDLWVRWHGDSK